MTPGSPAVWYNRLLLEEIERQKSGPPAPDPAQAMRAGNQNARYRASLGRGTGAEIHHQGGD